MINTNKEVSMKPIKLETVRSIRFKRAMRKLARTLRKFFTGKEYVKL